MPKQTYDWYLHNFTNENWAYANEVFNKDECEKLIKLITKKQKKYDFKDGNVGSQSENFRNDETVRRSKVAFIPSNDADTTWIFRKITDAVNYLNNNYFGYDIDKIETLQFSEYKDENQGFYEKHTDALYVSGFNRKLSFTVQLSDPESYEGGELFLHNGHIPDCGIRDLGSMTIFPSYTLHEVAPVTKGIRYSLVGWALGPRFK